MFTTETRSGLDTWLQNFAHIQVDPEDEHGPMGERTRDAEFKGDVRVVCAYCPGSDKVLVLFNGVPLAV